MYFNTTTIPSEYIDNRPDTWSGLCYGLFFIVTFVGGFFQQIYINYEKDARETCSSSGSSEADTSASEADTSASEADTSASAETSAETSASEAEAEIDTSIADFSNLLDRELTEDELTQLQFKIVREPTAGGEIIMTYHRETESFWYYAEHLKDVHYSMLETVARKFVIEYDCKRIYMQTALQEEVELTTLDDKVVEHKVVEPEQTKPIFAKFKKYNSGGKGANPNFKSVLKVVEQTNHFRYKGKLQDYANLIKERAEKEKAKASPILDYAAYRELLMAKKEN